VYPGQCAAGQLELMHQRNPDVIFDFVRRENYRAGSSCLCLLDDSFVLLPCPLRASVLPA